MNEYDSSQIKVFMILDNLSLHEILKSTNFRTKTQLYIKGSKIEHLFSFIDGYLTSLEIHQIREENQIDWGAFNFWVAKKLKRSESADWSMLIWVESFGDETASMSRFFKLYDEYFEESSNEFIR